MAKKKQKRLPLWFEDPFEDIRKTEEEFHRQMAEFWKEPMKLTIKFPKISGKIIRAIPVNLIQTKNELILRAQLPGFGKDEITLDVTPRTISIIAKKKSKKVKKGDEFYIESSLANEMRRMLTLPAEIKTDKVKAKFENGILEVRMPKKKIITLSRKKRIKIS